MLNTKEGTTESTGFTSRRATLDRRVQEHPEIRHYFAAITHHDQLAAQYSASATNNNELVSQYKQSHPIRHRLESAGLVSAGSSAGQASQQHDYDMGQFAHHSNIASDARRGLERALPRIERSLFQDSLRHGAESLVKRHAELMGTRGAAPGRANDSFVVDGIVARHPDLIELSDEVQQAGIQVMEATRGVTDAKQHLGDMRQQLPLGERFREFIGFRPRDSRLWEAERTIALAEQKLSNVEDEHNNISFQLSSAKEQVRDYAKEARAEFITKPATIVQRGNEMATEATHEQTNKAHVQPHLGDVRATAARVSALMGSSSSSDASQEQGLGGIPSVLREKEHAQVAPQSARDMSM